jgi:hypothetical protein
MKSSENPFPPAAAPSPVTGGLGTTVAGATTETTDEVLSEPQVTATLT